MAELDPRIVKIGIEVNGQLKMYEDLALVAVGTKYANANQNECEIKLTNLDKQTSDFILTETSPFNLNRTPKRAVVDAGRESYGTTRIFSGNIIRSSISQPPDKTITLKCLTANFQKGNIIARNQAGSVALSQLAKQVAADVGMALNFQAQDKQIANYTYSGAALNQVDKLNELGLISAYIDDDILIVKDLTKPLTNVARVLNVESGMIGIPEITDQGIKVKFLLDNQTKVGGLLQVQSSVYPAVNGNYMVYKLNFEIASRDTPFYYIAEAKRL